MPAELGSQAPEPLRSPLKRDAAPHGQDLFEALAEIPFLYGDPVYYGLGVKRGDGHPVMSIPCLKGDDFYLTWMRDWLQRIGYNSYPSHIINSGSVGKNIELIESDLESIVTRTNERASLVGHSLGGIFAFYLLKKRPDLVSTVVSLGSPVAQDPRKNSVVRDHDTYNVLRSVIPDDESAEDLFSTVQQDIPLPNNTKYFSIYTETDRIVEPKSCKHKQATGCFIVSGTHTGLAWNAQAFRIISNLLPENLNVVNERLPQRSPQPFPTAA